MILEVLRRRTARTRAAAVVAVLVATVAVAVPSAAQDRCAGVWVVVDATAVGGTVTTRCAPGDPSSGLAALEAAGHTYAFVPRQPGLVCTIDARPDPCNGAPEDAYWSYWHAPAGGAWTYASRGAGNRDPEPGTVEGWAFGAGDPPRRQPPAEASSDPDPEPEPEPGPGTDDGPVPTDDRSAPGEDAPATPAGDDGAGASTTSDPPTPAATAGSDDEATAGPTASPTAAPTGSAADADAPASPDAAPAPTPTVTPLAGVADGAVGDDAGPGLPVGSLLAAVLVAGIAGAGVVRARRRDGGA